MAVIKFLTEEEVACEIEDDSQYMMIQSQITYLHSCVEQWWVKGRGGGRGDKRNWLVHIPQDVIFLSQNFILTSCIANLT